MLAGGRYFIFRRQTVTEENDHEKQSETYCMFGGGGAYGAVGGGWLFFLKAG